MTLAPVPSFRPAENLERGVGDGVLPSSMSISVSSSKHLRFLPFLFPLPFRLLLARGAGERGGESKGGGGPKGSGG